MKIEIEKTNWNGILDPLSSNKMIKLNFTDKNNLQEKFGFPQEYIYLTPPNKISEINIIDEVKSIISTKLMLYSELKIENNNSNMTQPSSNIKGVVNQE